MRCTTAQEPSLAIQGQPYFEGAVLVQVSSDGVGEVPLLALGLDPLPAPLMTAKGPWFMGTLLLALPLVPIPIAGHLDVPLTMPPHDPGLVGIPLVMQALVDGVLTNPALLPFDEPYLEAGRATVLDPPNPKPKAEFGYALAAGDFNDDGSMDLAVSAMREDVGGVESAGRVYVFWGPDHTSHATLSTSTPRDYGFFGIHLEVDDLDGDGVDDLLVGETGGSPSIEVPSLRLYPGSASFPAQVIQVMGPGTGPQFSGYGYEFVTGDFDDDGHVDIAVSNNKAEIAGFAEAGQVDIYRGPDFATVDEIPNPDPETDAGFGSWLAAADMNGDGVMDLVEASPGDDVGVHTNLGSVHVVAGPGLVVAPPLACPEPLPATWTLFGQTVLPTDVDGDAELELVVSDGHDRVFVLDGPGHATHSVVRKPPVQVQNPFGETSFGWVIESRDVNADGHRDLLISDSFQGDLGSCLAGNTGQVFAVLGPWLSTFYPIEPVISACGDEFGHAMLLADVKAGGGDEVIVSQYRHDAPGALNAGRVVLLEY